MYRRVNNKIMNAYIKGTVNKLTITALGPIGLDSIEDFKKKGIKIVNYKVCLGNRYIYEKVDEPGLNFLEKMFGKRRLNGKKIEVYIHISFRKCRASKR